MDAARRLLRLLSSMPDNLREGGYSSYSGDPRELAQALVNHLVNQAGAPTTSFQRDNS